MDLLECYLNYSTNSNDINDNVTIDEYTKNLLEINKNLRSQVENLYKLLKIKLKFENCERLDKLLDELEILKSGLTFSMQKQTEKINDIHEIKIKEKEEIKNISLNKSLIDQKSHEILSLQEKLKSTEIKLENTHISLTEFEKKLSHIQSENLELRNNLNEEKSKTKNLVNLIKELEKKKSSIKSENECKKLQEELQHLTQKLSETEHKYKLKLEKKDLIIKKLDENLSIYEEELKFIKKEIKI